jgi:hypothetical protein
MITPKSRSEAIKLGLKRYKTEAPCKHGHYSLRITLSGGCLECRSTTYSGMLKSTWKSPKKLNQNKRWRNNKNKIASEKAKNARQIWTVKDIDIATKKGLSGMYVYTVSELTDILSRSYCAVQAMRRRINKL